MSGHLFYRTPTVDEADLPKWWRDLLVRATQTLALDPVTQATVLPGWVCVPDELRMDYLEAFKLVSQDPEAAGVPSHALQLAATLARTVVATPVIEDYHAELVAIAASPEWQAVREQAQALVTALGERVEPPRQGPYYVQ